MNGPLGNTGVGTLQHGVPQGEGRAWEGTTNRSEPAFATTADRIPSSVEQPSMPATTTGAFQPIEPRAVHIPAGSEATSEGML
jgi:hypothetical protein